MMSNIAEGFESQTQAQFIRYSRHVREDDANYIV